MTIAEKESAPPMSQERALCCAAGGVFLLAVAARLYLIFTTHATEEDFFITLRYARNIAHGIGFVYNVGEHVLGTTTPLYTLLLALAIRLHFDAALFGKLLSTAADAGSCLLVWRLGCTLERPIAGLCAALCFAIAPLNLTESVKGMESSLVACACIGAWALWAERKDTGAWGCAALVTLLRIDGAVLAVILLLACLTRDRKVPWRGLLAYTALTLPWMLYAGLAFGSPIPASLRAKLVVYGWHNHALLPNLVPFLRLMTRNPLALFLFAGAIAAAILAAWDGLAGQKTREKGLILVPMLAWLLVYYGGMAFSKVFLFGWYFLPPTTVYYLAAFVGWARLLAMGRRFAGSGTSKRPGLPLWAAACLIAGTLFALVTVPRVARTLRESQRVEDELRIPIGFWLKAHAASGDTVMLEPIGYIGYYSGLRVLDTVGLVSPEVLPFYREEEPSPYHALWGRFRPEWILLRAGEWEDLQRHEGALPPEMRLGSQYRLAQSWRSPDSPPDAAPAFLLFRRIKA